MRQTINSRASRAVTYLVMAAIALTLVGGSGRAIASPQSSPVLVESFAHPAFQRTWERTDRPLSFGQVSRSWYWGPNPNSGGLLEDYAEGVGGKRLVQYFDKSRMEINNPGGNQNDPFFVTNGLLTVELISGKMQVGNFAYVDRAPAAIPLASDTDDPNAPTYVSFQGVSNTTLGDHPAPNLTGQSATATINKAGVVGNDPAKANYPGTNFVHFEGITKHNIPKAVWDFLNLSGPIYDPNTGQNVNGRLSDPWFYTTGLPISEPYWASVKIANQPNVDVMIQAFERRVVTYVPSAPTGFKVQMGNIGQHYYDWRYGGTPPPTVQPVATNTPLPSAPTNTPVPAAPTNTPVPSHPAAAFAGTWLNDDTSTNSVGKLWITHSGANLTVKWFGVCTPTFCDNEQKTAPYTGEPFNITLDSRTFSLSFVDAAATHLKVVYKGTDTLLFHKARAQDYRGVWLNQDAGSNTVGKLWVTNSGGDLTVKWFGVCTPTFCDNEQKTAAYTAEPFNITLDGRTFALTCETVSCNKLGVLYQGSTANIMNKVEASTYNGTWNNIDPNTAGVVRFIITSSGSTVNVHWFGACTPTPCDNGTISANYTFEPLVVEDTSPPVRTFTITFEKPGGNFMKVIMQRPGQPALTYYLQK